MKWIIHTRSLIISSVLLVLIIIPSVCASTKLDFPETYQEQNKWCWAACSEAVLQYYGKSTRQCEIATYYVGSSLIDCCDNVVWPDGTGSFCNSSDTLDNLFYLWKGVKKILSHFGNIKSTYKSSVLSLDEIKSEIENGRPVMMGWRWTEGGGHNLVIYGVEDNIVYFLNPSRGKDGNIDIGEGLQFLPYNKLVKDSEHKWKDTLVIDTPSLPGAVSVDPSTDTSWTSSPQKITVSCTNADEIYYRLRYTTDGNDPKPPGKPSSISNDGSISGNSGQFEVRGIPGKKKILLVKFVGHNENGYGPVTGPFKYTIDLTGSSLDPKIAQLPMSGPPGTEFVQWGTGFTPGRTATLSFKKDDGVSEPTSKKQDLDGIGHFEEPYKSGTNKPLGTYCWKAVDDQTKRESNEVCYQITGSTGSVSGVLHENSAAGKVLSGAKVTCGGKTSKTQSNGSFSLSGVPAGNQTLAFSLSGYIAYQRSVVVVAGQNTDAGHRWLVKDSEDPTSSGPNLAVHELKIKKSSEGDSELGHKLRLAPGEKFDVKVWIKNRGKTKAKKAFTVKYLLSDDSQITASDMVIGIDTDKTDIGAGKTFTEWKQKIEAPPVPGTYYVGAWVDSPEDMNKENDFSRGDKERGKIIVEIPNQQPDGLLENSTCVSISGWARDPNTPSAIKVDVYADGPAGTGTFLGEVSASTYRSDLAFTDKYHGFTLFTPASLKDGKPHTIYAYAVDSEGGTNPLLNGSPISITCDAPLRPFIRYTSVLAYNGPSGIYTWTQAGVADPDGSLPGTIASLAVTGPNGFRYDYKANDYLSWFSEYYHGIVGLPADGEYTFTATDVDGKTAISHSYLTVGQIIPLPDSSTFQASGNDPLTPVLSFSTIQGYQGTLFYHARILDESGKYVWDSSLSYNSTSVTVPSGVLTSGQSYRWLVRAFDGFSSAASNKIVSSVNIPLSLDNTRPYFGSVAAYKIHNPDGTFSTGLNAVVGNPSENVISSLAVNGPGGFQYAFNTDEECSSEPGSVIHTCTTNVDSIPSEGVYTFTVTNSDNNTAISYFNLNPYDVPLVDSATARASGDLLAPVFSWRAPAGVEIPLYYAVFVKDSSDKLVWSSSITTNTSASVSEGILQPGKSYFWRIVANDAPYLDSSNISTTDFKELIIDNSSLYFTYANVYNGTFSAGNHTVLNARIGDANGTIPSSVVSLKVTGPGGFSYTFEPSDYLNTGDDEYYHRVPGHPQEGLYTFTLTDSSGNSLITYRYHRFAGGPIPQLDEDSFVVSGNPLAPTISWSTVSGYSNHLFYRLRIVDPDGNLVYQAPSPYSASSYRTVPSGKLVAGTSYKYMVEAMDARYFSAYDNRADSDYRSLPQTITSTKVIDFAASKESDLSIGHGGGE